LLTTKSNIATHNIARNSHFVLLAKNIIPNNLYKFNTNYGCTNLIDSNLYAIIDILDQASMQIVKYWQKKLKYLPQNN